MITLSDININQWFANRELDFQPMHFVGTKTAVTVESLQWIREKLTGRFILVTPVSYLPGYVRPFFEDHEEAIFYELRWG